MTVKVEGGAETGLSALFAVHRAELLRFLAARCGDPSEAEDLLQELWLKVGGARTGLLANGRAYLFRMASNLVLDRVRERHRAMRRDRVWLDRDEVSATDERADPSLPVDEAMLEAEERDMVRRAIEQLPESARQALVMYRFEGLGQAEIAQRLGISRSGVEKNLAVAMKHLRRALSDCGYFTPASSKGQNTTEGNGPIEGMAP